MKKIKALTLIEVLLVLVVIALILLVAMNQFQRYQQARNIQQAKNAVQLLAEYASQVFATNCANMINHNPQVFLLICPDSAANTLTSPPLQMGWPPVNGGLSPCSSFSLTNPFVPEGGNGINYVVQIEYGQVSQGNSTAPVPSVIIGLPISTKMLSKLHRAEGDPTNDPLLQKYIALLQPTFIEWAQKNTQVYIPGLGWSSGDNFESYNIDPGLCLTASKQSLCMLWKISLNNWGTLATNAANNQALNNQLAAFAGQYAPTKTEWTTIENNTGAQLNCPGFSARAVYQQHHPNPSP